MCSLLQGFPVREPISLSTSYGFVSFVLGDERFEPVGQLNEPELARVLGAVEPWTAEQRYLNLTETRCSPGAFWSEQAYHRLQRIKRAVDPDDVIRSNHPVTNAH